MSEPIVFISNFRIKEGSAEALKTLVHEVIRTLERHKPRTTMQAAYADEGRGTISFVHVFEDADVMTSHFEGADERARKAYEFMEPAGWEIYGTPSPEVVDQMRRTAAWAGVTLIVEPRYVAGFLRTV